MPILERLKLRSSSIVDGVSFLADTTKTYYLTSYASNGNIIETDSVTVTVSSVPSSPVVSSIQLNYCVGDVSSALSASALSGHTLNWYTSSGQSLSGAPTPSTASAGTSTYYVSQVNANGCESASTQITVTVSSLPQANITASSTPIICSGDSILFTVPLSNQNSYQWKLNGSVIPGATSNSFYAKLNGLYSIKVIDSLGCENMDNQNLMVKPALSSVQIIGQNSGLVPLTQYSYYVTLDTGITYDWSINNGANLSGNYTNSVVCVWNNVSSGKLVVLRQNGGCEQYDSLEVKTNLSIKEYVQFISIYPNPAQSEITLDIEDCFEYQIYNYNNQMVLEGKSEDKINISSIPSGHYKILINRKDGQIIKHFVKIE